MAVFHGDNMSEQWFTLQVYGFLWCGAKSCYQYSITREQCDMLLENENLRAYSGDFESVLDWRLVKETCVYEKVSGSVNRRIDTFKTLRGFSNGMTPQHFQRIINGVT